MIGTAQQLFQALSRGDRLPFYAVIGEEPFQAQEIVQRLRDAFFQGGDDTFSYERLDGDGLDGGSLVRSLQQMPGLFAEENARRLVLCNRFEKASAGALEKLEFYFADPSPTTSLILVAEKADKRKAWYKAVDKKGFVVEVSEPRDRDWIRWHRFFETRVSKGIDPEAWERLVSACGGQLATLASDAEKLALYVGKAPRITGADAAAVLEPGLESDIFRFVDDVVDGRKLAAFVAYRRLTASGEADVKLLALVSRQFLLLDRAASYPSQDSRELAQAAGAHPFAAQKAVERARKHPKDRWSKGVQTAAAADFRLKTGHGDLVSELLTPWFASIGA